jgi:hypothetical protein
MYTLDVGVCFVQDARVLIRSDYKIVTYSDYQLSMYTLDVGVRFVQDTRVLIRSDYKIVSQFAVSQLHFPLAPPTHYCRRHHIMHRCS